jgi:hypothetical protein
VVWLQNHSDG